LNAGKVKDRDRTNSYLLVALFALTIFPSLLLLRSFDDNTLTSWQWAAAAADPARVFLLVALGIVAAYPLSSLPLHEKSPALLLFVVATAAAAVFWTLPEVVIDASRYFTQAKHLELYGVRYFLREWGTGIDAWTDMPLIPFVYGLVFRYLGESRLYVQILNSFLFASAVVATYHSARILWDRETGFLAALLLLGMPYLYTQVPLMLADIPTMFLLAVTTLASLTALLRGNAWLLVPMPAIALTAAAKYSTWPLLAAGLPLAVLASGAKVGMWTAVRRGAILLVASAGVVGTFLLWKLDVVSEQIALLTDFQWQGLSWWQESYLSTFFFQIHPFVTLLALLGGAMAIKRRDVTCLLPLGLVALLIVMRVERARYLLVVFPMVAMAAGYGLQTLGSGRLKRFVALCAFSYSLAVAAFFYRPFLMNVSLVNLKEAGELLNSRRAATADVRTLPPGSLLVNPAVAVPLLDIYYSGRISYDPGSKTTSRDDTVRQSPFRFSWDYRNPGYYALGEADGTEDSAVVVISGEAKPPLPPGLAERTASLERHSLAASSGVFRYRTLLSIYLPAARQE
jgi:hypothetical protein